MSSSEIIVLKSKEEIARMRESGEVVSTILTEVGNTVAEGINTMELEEVARKLCKLYKVKPAFLGYHGFPAILCISINEEVVHGIPSKKRKLQNGDIVSIDMGVVLNEYFSDTARTFIVGETGIDRRMLVEKTKEALDKAIAHMVPGGTLHELSSAVYSIAKDVGLGVVKQYCGHGIGKALHEHPPIFNYIPKNYDNIVLKEGMVFAIEPMFTLGSSDTKVLKDGWTVVTSDGSCAAHFEHTVAITENGPEILTIYA